MTISSYFADLHIHSAYSRATSKQCNLEGFYILAQCKGIQVVATGDVTHPAWFAELQQKLEPAGEGLYQLRPELSRPLDAQVPAACRAPVYFLLSGEVSNIYKRAGATRKNHSLVLFPHFEAVAHFNQRLGAIGNIEADGRPILGLDVRDLLELVLESDDHACLIPAHIWTPWFSMLGSKSGFDSLQECFGDLAPHIFCVETGLSSDPPMNWRVGFLDGLALSSNSDLHSPAKLGRNANLFYGQPSYYQIVTGLRQRDPYICGGTIDMFPEDGKYHYDGHRQCGICLHPEESLQHANLCPVCGKPLTLGVLHRVVALASRGPELPPRERLPHQYIIPLPELLAELYSQGENTKKVQRNYQRLLQEQGPELPLLLQQDPATLEGSEPPLLAEAIRRLRREQVVRQPGYDGFYGCIRVFDPGEMERLQGQDSFFSGNELTAAPEQKQPQAQQAAAASDQVDPHTAQPAELPEMVAGLTPAQQAAVTAGQGPQLIIAGPGTGKTRTLIRRIEYLLAQGLASGEDILAITFTNRAAQEMRQRLAASSTPGVQRPWISTFHRLCYTLLRHYADHLQLKEDFCLLDDEGEALPEELQQQLHMPRRRPAASGNQLELGF